MAFVFCDDHNASVEADDIEPAAARRLLLGESGSNPAPAEAELIEFGRVHRDCNLRVVAG
jgi:hypothetical protein